jgi:hypothetical protein
VIDEGRALCGELLDRLEVDLSQRDRLAAASAVTKALMIGVRLGSAEVVAQAIEKGVDTHVTHDIGDEELRASDLWAREYGDQDEG